MLQLRYRTAPLLGIALLSVGGFAGYLIYHNNPPSIDKVSDSAATLPVATHTEPDPKQARAATADNETKQACSGTSVIVPVFAKYPGAAPEEVERRVTIPLEAGLKGIPQLESLQSKSLFGTCWLYAHFQPGTNYEAARQEVINCLNAISTLPPLVAPTLAPCPGRHSLRYILLGPRNAQGQSVYRLHDLRSLQDWVLEREFRRVPGVADVESTGGIVKRYEIHPDPDRLRRYGITLKQLEQAIANANMGGDQIDNGPVAKSVRDVGLFGGKDPFSAEVLKADTPEKAASLLQAGEQQRLLELRAQVVSKINDQPVRVEDLVEGGLARREDVGMQGVVIGSHFRNDRVLSEDSDVIEGNVLLRADEDPKLLHGVQERIRELNATAGKLLPGLKIEPYFDSTDAAKNNLWVYGTLPEAIPPGQASELAKNLTEQLHQSPEVERIVSRFGGEPSGTHEQSINQMRFFVGLKASAGKPSSRVQLIAELKIRLSTEVPMVAWWTTTHDPQELERTFPGTPAEHLLMLIGPDLMKLERMSGQIRNQLKEVPGDESVGVFQSTSQARFNYRLDPEKCAKWGVKPGDVNLKELLQLAQEGKVVSNVIEGGQFFELALRWPKPLRSNEDTILDIPFDTGILKNEPSNQPITSAPRLRIRDLVSPIAKGEEPDGIAAIYRKNGERLLPIRFSVHGRPLKDVKAEAVKKIAPLLKEPYRIEWSDLKPEKEEN